LDWKRPDPNNRTVSAGVDSYSGERCAYLAPWQEDPLSQEQGSIQDFDCDLPKAYICQSYARTTKYAVTANSVVLLGGEMIGGSIKAVNEANITMFRVTSSGSITVISSSPKLNVLQTLLLEDASALIIAPKASITAYGGAFIGEPLRKGSQSSLQLSVGSRLLVLNNINNNNNIFYGTSTWKGVILNPNSTEVVINARFVPLGSVFVDSKTSFRLKQVIIMIICLFACLSFNIYIFVCILTLFCYETGRRLISIKLHLIRFIFKSAARRLCVQTQRIRRI
jgi:hypothetical protein